jgi:glycosyltransferase involved in cell wall biosynthesis
MEKKLLILGPNPYSKNINHAGGQLTAITNLLKYLDDLKIPYILIDTFRSTFPPPSMWDKIQSSHSKYLEIKKLLKKFKFKGAIVFASYGFGYWEKILFSLILEQHGVKTLFFIRSGHFMNSIKSSNYIVPIKRFLMNRVSYIGHQGGEWEKFYKRMGIEESRLIKLLSWIEINDYIKNLNRSDRITFLYVGWIVKKKGVNELLNVILANRDLDKFYFIFIGGGTLLEELKEKVREAKANNIKFTGWLKQDEVLLYYKRCDVFILPSHAEGFPNVILEALNYQLPIISTNVGAVSESVIDNYNGFLIEVGDEKGLLKAILKLGNSKTLRKKFSINGKRILKKNHTIETNCKKMIALFEVLLTVV